MPSFEELRRDWLIIPDPPVEPGLRRCVDGHHDRSRPASCPRCLGPTVGLDLVSVYTGEDELLAADLARREKVRGTVGVLALAIAAVALLRVLTYVAISGTLAAFAALLTSSFVALGFVIALVLGARAYLEFARGQATHGARVEDLSEKLEKIREQILEPFLSRNGIGEAAAVRAPQEELALLEQAFAREGLVPRFGSLPLLVAAAALRRDLRRFVERLDATGAPDRFFAYARAVPDERLLPLLEEVLADEGGVADDVAERVRACRSDRKLETFLGDLEQRRGGNVLAVTVEALDAIDAASFEALLLMLLESEGFERREGALARHGEKTAFSAKQEKGAVDTPAVQEALVAKTRLGCERALVVTNGSFTQGARELASKNGVELVDRERLAARLETFNRSPKDYGRLAALLAPRSPP